MSTSVTRLALLSFLAVSLSAQQRNHAEAPPVPRSVDHYGDPLPPGAVARLGTLRFVHLGGLSSVAIAPDGKVVASGVTRGKEVYLGEKILHQKNGFTLGTGERLTLTAVRLWDADKGTVIREVTSPDAPVSCLHFALDGRTLFAGCGRFVCAWDVGTGKQLWQQEGVPGGRFHYGVRAEKLVLAKDKLISLHSGTLLCPVSHDGGGASFFYHPQVVVRLWDLGTGKSLPTPEALQSTVKAEGHIATLFHDAAVSSDGRFAAVLASRAEPLPRDEDRRALGDTWKYTGRRLQLVDLGTGKVCHTLPDNKEVIKSKHSSPFDKVISGALAFSVDDDTLAVAEEGEITLVETASGRKNLLAKGLPERPRLAFVGSKELAAELRGGTVRAWDVGTGMAVDPKPAHSHALLQAHNGRLAVTTHDNTLRLTDLLSGKSVHAYEGHRRTPLVRFALHSPDILLSSDGDRACLWARGSWKQETLTIPEGLSSHRYFFSQESLDEGVSWEKGLYVWERDKRLELWDVKTARPVRTLADVPERTQWSLFSASGDRLVVQASDGYRFFDVGTGKALSQLPRSKVAWLGPNSPEISPRGTYFARTEKGDQVGLYEVSSGKLLRTLTPRLMPEKGHSVLRFHFAADEQTLFGEVHQAIAFDNGFSQEKVSVTLWDVPSGEILQEIVIAPKIYSFWRQALSEPQVGTVALSPDRRLAALARTDGKDIEIWETASGTKRGVLSGHDGPVVSLSFSADGKQVASGSEDTTVLVWDLHRPLQAIEPKGHFKSEELAAHWKTLACPEAKEAERAIWYLTWAAGDAVPFMKEHLRPVTRPDAGHLKKLLADLDSDEFKTRSAAGAEIEGLGEQLLGELEKAKRQKNSPEKQRRLESLLSAAQVAARPFGTAEKVRQWRALEILEKAATPDAVRLLKDLAAGVPSASLTQEACAALERLASRTKIDR
jgi:WD40 repeat protein